MQQYGAVQRVIASGHAVHHFARFVAVGRWLCAVKVPQVQVLISCRFLLVTEVLALLLEDFTVACLHNHEVLILPHLPVFFCSSFFPSIELSKFLHVLT